MTKGNSGKEGFVQLGLPHHCSSLKEVRIGTQAGQEPGGQELMQGPWRSVHPDFLLIPPQPAF